MPADCHIIHPDNELSTVSKDQVLFESFATDMIIFFSHDFLFAKVSIRTDFIVVLLKTTSYFFFFLCFRSDEMLLSMRVNKASVISGGK